MVSCFLQTILQSYSNQKSTAIKPKILVNGKIENLEINLYKYSHLIKEKESKNKKGNKASVTSSIGKTEQLNVKRMKLGYFLTPCTKIN